jgi:folate-dependent phosphoribosylglycinamide formyltransferase PurN
MKRIGILLSGRGSNFEAIARQIDSGKLMPEIAVVVSNVESAPGCNARAIADSMSSCQLEGFEPGSVRSSVIHVWRRHVWIWFVWQVSCAC